ncbi:Uncharacterised protein [Pseudomonas aeruginosa]|nr:Uncharacterised protein [Pseudomonas aeruginosa]
MPPGLPSPVHVTRMTGNRHSFCQIAPNLAIYRVWQRMWRNHVRPALRCRRRPLNGQGVFSNSCSRTRGPRDFPFRFKHRFPRPRAHPAACRLDRAGIRRRPGMGVQHRRRGEQGQGPGRRQVFRADQQPAIGIQRNEIRRLPADPFHQRARLLGQAEDAVQAELLSPGHALRHAGEDQRGDRYHGQADQVRSHQVRFRIPEVRRECHQGSRLCRFPRALSDQQGRQAGRDRHLPWRELLPRGRQGPGLRSVGARPGDRYRAAFGRRVPALPRISGSSGRRRRTSNW